MKKFSKNEVYEKLENVLYSFCKENNLSSELGEKFDEMIDDLGERLVNEFELEDSFEIVY